MPNSAKYTFICGILFILLSLVNISQAEAIVPSLLRAEVLACMSSVGLLLVSILWTQANPKSPDLVTLEGKQGFSLYNGLSKTLKKELAWGSHLFLTATSAAVILVYWDNRVILIRGIIGDGVFEPGKISQQARQKGTLISLVKTDQFPGRKEFDSITHSLPSIVVYPLRERGWVIIGGLSARCFSKTDERWIEGWSEKLVEELLMTND